MINKVYKVVNAFLDRKLTAFGISIFMLVDFICLILMGMCLVLGAPVDGWIFLFIVMDTIWSYLAEKKKDNHYFYGE